MISPQVELAPLRVSAEHEALIPASNARTPYITGQQERCRLQRIAQQIDLEQPRIRYGPLRYSILRTTSISAFSASVAVKIPYKLPPSSSTITLPIFRSDIR